MRDTRLFPAGLPLAALMGAVAVALCVLAVPVAYATAPQCIAAGGGSTIEVEVGEEVLVGTCFDDDDEAVTLTLSQAPTRGQATINDDSVEYRSTAAGADVLQFRAAAGGQLSSVVTVTTMNVGAPNKAPVCAIDDEGFTGTVGVPTVVAECTDLDDGDTVAVATLSASTRGLVGVQGQGGLVAQIVYTPTSEGGDVFRVAASDGEATATYEINGVNVAAPANPPLMTPPPPGETSPTPVALPPVPGTPVAHACQGLSGAALASCQTAQKIAAQCSKLKSKKKTACAKRVRAFAICARMPTKTKKGRAKKQACVRKARLIGAPKSKRRAVARAG